MPFLKLITEAAEQQARTSVRGPPGNRSDKDGVEPGTPARLIGESRGDATITLTMRIPRVSAPGA